MFKDSSVIIFNSKLADFLLPKRFVAITLFGKVYIKSNIDASSKLIAHELKHVLQQKEKGMLLFAVTYIFFFVKNLIKTRDLHKSYRLIPYEVSARIVAASREERIKIFRIFTK